MSLERSVQIDGHAVSSDHLREVASNMAQQEILNPNSSETMKDAATDVAVEAINQIPPPTQND